LPAASTTSKRFPRYSKLEDRRAKGIKPTVWRLKKKKPIQSNVNTKLYGGMMYMIIALTNLTNEEQSTGKFNGDTSDMLPKS
jgi:hypothetical protein